MWECNYGSEPIDMKLLVLRFVKKIWIVVLAAVLGALLIGGPYYLRKVTFGPAKEYQAITDFYMDYALLENGEQHTYFNQTTWTQLIGDDVFTDKILGYLQTEENTEAASVVVFVDSEGKNWSVTKDMLRESLYATMLSDTRIVTTTVTTNNPDLTMKINDALLLAMDDFGQEQKEIAGVRILQQPTEAELVKADVRTFRACTLGTVIFVFVVLLWMLCSFVLDDSVYVPIMFERRYHLPMLGTVNSKEMPPLFKKLCPENSSLLVMDEGVDAEKVIQAVAEKTGCTLKAVSVDGLLKDVECKRSDIENSNINQMILVVKAGNHNGKAIEKTLSICKKCDIDVKAALLWDADETLIKRYEGK